MAHARENAFNKHTAEFREKAAVLSHDVQELGKITKEIAGDTVNLFRENAADYYDEGMKKAQKLEKGLEHRIQENPLQSLLIAAGVGLIMGMFWNHRR
jgi:ElaB/YqjD/DUF883 family membrane-anchored ribosome-binding protein